MLELADLGPRIMICGPSNSEKSTLAVAIGRKRDLPAIHLDQFRHLPNTDWQQRPDEAFRLLHDDAIVGERWVIDGNYSSLMPPRIARATGIILLGDNRWANLLRYFRRTLFEPARPGNLEGAQDTLKWAMVRWILVVSPENLKRYKAELPAAGLPFIGIDSMRELRRAYENWGLAPQ